MRTFALPLAVMLLALGCPGDPDPAPTPTADVPSVDGGADPGGGAGDTGPSGPCVGQPDGAPCNDGDVCTDGDVCAAGSCVGGEPVVCDVSEACRVAACDPESGCVQSQAEDGTACDAPCFELASCVFGVCVAEPGAEIECPPSTTNCVAAWLCDPGHDSNGKGACSVPVLAQAGTLCNKDGDACTREECSALGKCEAAGEETCQTESDADPCWSWACSTTQGCVPHLFATGAACDDSDACTVLDVCTKLEDGTKGCGGGPKDVDDQNPCTKDACDDGAAVHQPLIGEACVPESPCTDKGICQQGACVPAMECECSKDEDCIPGNLCLGAFACDLDAEVPKCVLVPDTAVVCGPSALPCHGSECLPATGECIDVPLIDGAPCDDGELCTEGDTCLSGTCAAGTPKDCTDAIECTTDGCDEAGNCTHALADGFCLVAGVCHPAGSVGPCQSCNPEISPTALLDAPVGAECSDGDACTAGEACTETGQCAGGVPLDCDDQDPCTTNTCKDGECVTGPASGLCDDGLYCTTEDTCEAGECVGKPLECDDKGPCATVACDEASDDCVVTPAPDGDPCDDANPCTAGDQCALGTCLGTPFACDDTLPCTQDACVTGGGCDYTLLSGHCLIDGVCFDALAAGPDGACSVCSPEKATDGWTALEEGAACDDGDACTTGETCTSGACVPADGSDCDDDDPCTIDACQPGGGCTHEPAEAGASCEAGDVCLRGACTAGGCSETRRMGQWLLGGPGKDALRAVEALDVGFVAVGSTDASGSEDAWVIRLNGDGATDWEKVVGGPGADRANALALLPDGDFVVAGMATLPEPEGYKGWLTRLTPGGETIWAHTFAGESGLGRLEDVVVTEDGQVVAVGASPAGTGAWALWVGADGVLAASKPLGGVEAVAVSARAAGGVLAAVHTEGPWGYQSGLVLALDATSALEWTAPVSAENGDTVLHAVAALPDGGAVVTGRSLVLGAGQLVGFVRRLQPGGPIAWTRTLREAGWSVSPHPDGGFLAAGTDTFRLDGAGQILLQNQSPAVGLSVQPSGDFLAVASQAAVPGGSQEGLLIAADRWGATDCLPTSPCHALSQVDCSDPDPCTADQCSDGGCTNPSEISGCDVQSPCQAGACDPDQGCVTIIWPDDTPCPGGRCIEGQCVPAARLVAAGPEHTCAVRKDSVVVCFGNPAQGRLGQSAAPVTPGSFVETDAGPVAVLAASDANTCALALSGPALCWGDNSQGQLTGSPGEPLGPTAHLAGLDIAIAKFGGGGAPPYPDTVHRWQICVTGAVDGRVTCRSEVGDVPLRNHADATRTAGRCFLHQSGSVRCGMAPSLSTPMPLITWSAAVDISTSGGDCVVTSFGGSVRCRGPNDYGQLGNGTTDPAAKDVQVAGLWDVADVEAAADFACARTDEGAVWCWGRNDFGQLGRGETSGLEVLAKPVPGLAAITSLAVGTHHACARTDEAVVRCWGRGAQGQLGNGAVPWTTAPASVPSISGASAVAGSQHALVLAGGQVYAFGRNDIGQLGIGGHGHQSSPVAVSGLDNALAVAAGDLHSCVVLEGGAVSCMGSNDHGQLGDGSTWDRDLPGPVSGISDATAVAAGAAFTCALLDGGTVRCWGRGTQGQLGGAADSSIPVQVAGVTAATSLAAGGAQACVRTASGDVRCWGDGDPTPTAPAAAPKATQVSVGLSHGCAVTPANQVACWGSNEEGQLGPPSGVDQTAQVAAGARHTCAVRTDSSVWCWGTLTADGPVSAPVEVLPAGPSPTVRAGHDVTWIVHADGALSAFGDASTGALGDGKAFTATPFEVPASP